MEHVVNPKRSNSSNNGSRVATSATAAAATVVVSTNRKTTTTKKMSAAEAAIVHFDQYNHQNIMSKLLPENLYQITTFLDEVALYCFEKAFPLQINTPTVSHQRWNDMLEYQQQEYSSEHIGEEEEEEAYCSDESIAVNLVRMLDRNDGLLTDVTPRWPPLAPKDQNAAVDVDPMMTTPMARGRQFAQEILQAKEQLRSVQELTPDKIDNEYSRRSFLHIRRLFFECRFTRELNILNNDDDDDDGEVFVTLVTHDGHHFATSMPNISWSWSNGGRTTTSFLPKLFVRLPSPSDSYRFFKVKFEHHPQQLQPLSATTKYPSDYPYRRKFGKFYTHYERVFGETLRAYYPENGMVRIMYRAKDDDDVDVPYFKSGNKDNKKTKIMLCYYRKTSRAEIEDWRRRMNCRIGRYS